MSGSLPIVTGFTVVDWECPACDATNYADDFGPAQCHWCEQWAAVAPRGLSAAMNQSRVKTLGKFRRKKNRKEETGGDSV
jgi:hypothetical protein